MISQSPSLTRLPAPRLATVWCESSNFQRLGLRCLIWEMCYGLACWPEAYCNILQQGTRGDPGLNSEEW